MKDVLQDRRCIAHRSIFARTRGAVTARGAYRHPKGRINCDDDVSICDSSLNSFLDSKLLKLILGSSLRC